MKHRGLALVMTAACAVLTVIAAFIYLRQDNTPPEIKIEERDITYAEGEGHDALMEGVSAVDKADGDLSDKVFVSKIVLTSEDSAIVYYGVMDDSKNIGTARRRVNYKSQAEEEPPAEETAGEVGAEGMEGNMSPEQMEPLEPNGPKPIMALTTDQMTIKAGENFDPLSIVRDAVDDKDDKNTLYQHIHTDGTYDVRTRGSYEIRYYVTDTDGNASDPIIFTLTVE